MHMSLRKNAVLFVHGPTANFCSCQPGSRVATIVGDEEWAFYMARSYLAYAESKFRGIG